MHDTKTPPGQIVNTPNQGDRALHPRPRYLRDVIEQMQQEENKTELERLREENRILKEQLDLINKNKLFHRRS